jgi:hypothetical protein
MLNGSNDKAVLSWVKAMIDAKANEHLLLIS